MERSVIVVVMLLVTEDVLARTSLGSHEVVYILDQSA